MNRVRRRPQSRPRPRIGRAGAIAALVCVAALGLAACGSNDEQTTTLQQQNTTLQQRSAALAQRNAALKAQNRKLAAENAALTRKVTNTAQQNALLELEGVDRASRVQSLKAQSASTERAAARARAAAAALGATAAELGNRNGKLRARAARLRSQLHTYESAAQTAAVQWAKAEAVSQTLLRCTDLVRKAVVGSRSAGAARDVCRAAAKRVQAYEAG